MAKRHRGRKALTLDDLVVIGLVSFANACDLFTDAEVLFANERWSRTMFLCFIAREELAKSCLSLGAAAKVRLGEFGPEQQERYRERFEDHREKTATFLAILDAFFSRSPLPEIVKQLRERTTHVHDAETVKLGSLYADLGGSNEPHLPGSFYKDADMVKPFLEDVRQWIEMFNVNIRPLFTVVRTCPIEDCRKWMDALKDIL
jgi:AbiV family abortive infection protein